MASINLVDVMQCNHSLLRQMAAQKHVIMTNLERRMQHKRLQGLSTKIVSDTDVRAYKR